MTERGLKNIFRIMGRDDQQGLVAGTFLAEHFKGLDLSGHVTLMKGERSRMAELASNLL